MKIKLAEVGPLLQLMENFKGIKLSMETLHKIYLFITEMEGHNAFYQEKFKELIDEFGKKDENNELELTEDKKGVLIQDEFKDQFFEKLGELNEIEVKAPDIKFTLSEFKNMDSQIELMFPFFAKFM